MPVDLSPLREHFQGVITTPSSPTYERERVLFNTRIRRRPAGAGPVFVHRGRRRRRPVRPGGRDAVRRPRRRAPRLRVLPGRGRSRGRHRWPAHDVLRRGRRHGGRRRGRRVARGRRGDRRRRAVRAGRRVPDGQQRRLQPRRRVRPAQPHVRAGLRPHRGGRGGRRDRRGAVGDRGVASRPAVGAARRRGRRVRRRHPDPLPARPGARDGPRWRDRLADRPGGGGVPRLPGPLRGRRRRRPALALRAC